MIKFRQFITESELDGQLKKLGIKRTNKFSGIGKEMGSDVYVHKNYEHTFPQDELAAAKAKLPENFEYHVVKYNPKTKYFSFIVSNDFDTNPEPSVNGGYTVKPDAPAKAFGDNGWIYHHKWMWVADDYKGFDVEENKRRSLKWSSLSGVDKARIGQRKFWDANVIPLINESLILEDKFTDIITKYHTENPKYARNGSKWIERDVALFRELVKKHQIKGAEADIQYWFKKPYAEFSRVVGAYNWQYEASKRGKKARASAADMPVVFENDKCTIKWIKTHGAMMKTCSDMDWCISSNNETFESYIEDGATIYVIFSKLEDKMSNTYKVAAVVVPENYDGDWSHFELNDGNIMLFDAENAPDGMYYEDEQEFLHKHDLSYNILYDVCKERH